MHMQQSLSLDHAEPLKKTYKGKVQTLKDDDRPVKAVQKLLLNSVIVRGTFQPRRHVISTASMH